MAVAIAVWCWVIIMALATGSFLGVVISRLPNHEPILLGRSECPHCHTRLGALDLMPVASFVLQKARCRYCGAKIDPYHLWVELAALVVVLLAVWRGGSTRNFLDLCLLGFILMPIAWIDATHRWLPDRIVLPGILIGLAMCWWIAPHALVAHILGAALGFAVLATVRGTFRRVTGRDLFSLGAAKLLALAGAWTGWQYLGPILLCAAIVGIALALIDRARHKPAGPDPRIPLGTYMAPFIYLAALRLLP